MFFLERIKYLVISIFIILLSLIYAKIGLDKKRKCSIVIKNYLDEVVTFSLLTSKDEVNYKLMPKSSYFYELKEPNDSVVMKLPTLGNKLSHYRTLKYKGEYYKLIHASFVAYDTSHKDLRVRRVKV